MKRVSAILALALCVAPGFAQETGTLINRGATAGINGRTANDARGMMLGYAVCVAGRSPGRIKAMVALPMSDPRYEQIHRSLFEEYSDCLSGGLAREISFSGVALRGAIFEALYRREYAKAGPTDFATVAKINYADGYTQPIDGRFVSSIALANYGDCVSRRDANDARALVLSAPGSAQENQAFGGLMTNFGPCLPKGEQLRFSKTILRGAIAEGLYRLSIPAAPAGR